MSQKRVNIAIVGLGFGAEFIPIYRRHLYAHPAARKPGNSTNAG